LHFTDLEYAIGLIIRERGVPQDVVVDALEAALVSAYRKEHGKEIQPRIILKPDGGKMDIHLLRQVVKEMDDPDTEISLDEAKTIDPEAGYDDFVECDGSGLDLEFGRIAAQAAKQVVMQRIKEAERDLVYQEFLGREGELITGKIRRREKGQVYVELDKAEGLIPPSEQLRNERYVPRSTIKAMILEVKQTPKGPRIILSRAHPDFVRRLFELEVPEILEGTVEVVRIARDAGFRTKMAVYSNSNEVDPVGACVGSKGSRVQAVVNELKGENIDIIHWTEDPFDFIANALAPAKVYSVEIFDDEERAEVIVPEDQASLAIGTNGQNVRLAIRLTGWDIDIRNDKEQLDQEIKARAADREKEIEELMNMPVGELPLRKPAIDGLTEAGYKTLGDLMSEDRATLLSAKGFGEAALSELEKYLNQHGLSYETYEEAQQAEAEAKAEAEKVAIEEVIEVEEESGEDAESSEAVEVKADEVESGT
jgi:N utilization substance protein A